jgi:hypothetical protein
MKWRIHVDRGRGFIYVRAWGTASLASIRSAQAAIAAHPQFQPTYSSIFDLRQLNFTPLRSTDVASLGSQTAFAETARRVLVVSTAEHFGLARMYQAHSAINVGHRDTINVVYTLNDALDWLGLDPLAIPADGDAAPST